MWTRTSPEQRKRFLDQLAKNQQRQKRRRRLYNKMYRKGFPFVSAWLVRIIFIALFISVCFLHHKHGSYATEVVLFKEIDQYTYMSGRSLRSGASLYILTDHGEYYVNISRMSFRDFNKRDTLVIERNIFGRPIYFSRIGWTVAYPFGINFKFYFVVLFATLISFAFNNGLDRPFTPLLLKIITAFNLFAIGCYFLA